MKMWRLRCSGDKILTRVSSSAMPQNEEHFQVRDRLILWSMIMKNVNSHQEMKATSKMTGGGSFLFS